MEATAITPGSTGLGTVERPGLEGLNSEDFFKLLIAQLSNQDPLEPMSNQELLNQISSIRDIEASTTLTRTLKSLADNQGVGSAAGLIGQHVSGRSVAADGTVVPVSGLVIGLRVDPNRGMLVVLNTGEELPLARVDQVTTARQFAEALRGRLVGGVDRDDPSNPIQVEGLVTGTTTDDEGQIVLELDNGRELRLSDVTAAASPTDEPAESS